MEREHSEETAEVALKSSLSGRWYGILVAIRYYFVMNRGGFDFLECAPNQNF